MRPETLPASSAPAVLPPTAEHEGSDSPHRNAHGVPAVTTQGHSMMLAGRDRDKATL